MEFSRQEFESIRISEELNQYWSGLPVPSPGNLSDPGIEPGSLMSPALADEFFTTRAT